MSTLGLALFAAVGIGLVATGLPAFAILIAAAMVGAIVGVAAGTIPLALLNALPGRIVALLEHDLLQALPLYVLMGVLLERMHVAPALFRLITWSLPRRPAAPVVAGLGLGALLGPMNGSVGASVLAIARSVGPRLAEAGVPPPLAQAITALAGTLGVVIPPSLVLILLGDAMLTAHTIAVNATGRTERIINTQDVLGGAMIPALIMLLAMMATAWLAVRRRGGAVHAIEVARPSGTEFLVSIVALVFLVGLLGGVALGRFYAVEAAATGALVLFACGLASRRIRVAQLGPMLSEVLVTTGVLFAPLMAATAFTLVLRLLGTDRLVAGWLTALPGGDASAIAVVLILIALSAFVLDAFEIIFVVVPILIPALLMRVSDAVWVAVLVLLTLQASFLMPPVGYALMMTRSALGAATPLGPVIRALAPFLAVQAAVLALLIAFPQLVHIGEKADSRSRGGPNTPLAPGELERRMREMLPAPVPPGAPGGLPPFAPASVPPLPPAR